MIENQNSEHKSKRGFAAMTRDRRREIARQGGRAAHEQGVAHEWNKDEAKAAGKKGELASRSTKMRHERKVDLL